MTRLVQGPAKQTSADSTIAELLDRDPAAARILLRHGMACIGCSMAPFETLADAAREYGVDPVVLLSELAPGFGPRRRRRSAAAKRRTGKIHRREP